MDVSKPTSKKMSHIDYKQVKKILDEYESIELLTAPKSYFYAADLEQIHERSKRSDIRKILQNPGDESDELASFLMLAGSDLPKLKDDEVEIARLEFNTTIGNVYSLRANWADEIEYRIVTEIADFEITVPIKHSIKPLTLREVIEQFEQAAPTIGLNDLAYAIKEGSEDNLEHYISAQSAFYSGLSQFYQYASAAILTLLHKN